MPVIRMPDGVLVRFGDNMSKEEIKAKIATKFPDFAASKGYVSKSALQLTDDQKAQIKANIDAYRQRQEANMPWANKSRLGRSLVAVAQGVVNALGYKDDTFKPENVWERALSKGSEYGYDTAAFFVPAGKVLKGAGLLGKGKKLTSKIARALLAPSTSAIAPAIAGGATEGAVNANTTEGDIIANLAGGLLFEGARGLPKRSFVTIKSGLENIANNPDALRIVRRAAKYDDNIAKEVIKGASEAADNINHSSYDAIEKVLNGVTNQERYKGVRSSYEKFIEANASKKVPDLSLKRLNPYQARKLKEALKKGLDIAEYGTKEGTLGHILTARQMLDEFINDSFRQEFPAKKATIYTDKLGKLRDKVDAAISKIPFAKGYDRDFTLYKQFSDAYKKGLQYNPGSPKNVLNDILLSGNGDKEKAIMAKFGLKKGLFDKLAVDIRADKNFSKNAKNYQNVLKQLLYPDEYENVINTLVNNETAFNRLGKLTDTAENRLVTPEGSKFFGREQWESKGATSGAFADWLLSRLNAGYYKDAASKLLKGGENIKVLTSPAYQQAIKNLLKGSAQGLGYNARTTAIKELLDDLKNQ